MKIIDSEQQKEKQINRNENSLREPWDNSKQTNIHIIGVPEGEEIEKGIENVFEEISEDFPNQKKKTDIQSQELFGIYLALKISNKMNPIRPTLRQNKMAKVR